MQEEIFVNEPSSCNITRKIKAVNNKPTTIKYSFNTSDTEFDVVFTKKGGVSTAFVYKIFQIINC